MERAAAASGPELVDGWVLCEDCLPFAINFCSDCAYVQDSTKVSKQKMTRFRSSVQIEFARSRHSYDRSAGEHSMPRTTEAKFANRREMNEFKTNEMVVHPSSEGNTWIHTVPTDAQVKGGKLKIGTYKDRPLD